MLEIMKYLCPLSSSPRVPRWSKRKFPWSLARTFEPGAASCSGSGMRAGSSFYRTIGLGCSRSMFSAVDALPKGALTVSFKFHLLARRLVSSLNLIGIKSGNLLSFATTKDGNSVYFDLNNEAFDLPASGGYSSGWHQVTVSFDSATGVVQAYFNGRLGVNRTGFRIGKPVAATLGPGLLFFCCPDSRRATCCAYMKGFRLRAE